MNILSFKKLVIALSIITLPCGCAVNTNSQSNKGYILNKDSYKFVLDHFDKMGIDDTSILNNVEGTYFNILFCNQREQFDFCNKRVVFFWGPSGTNIRTKRDFLPKSSDEFVIEQIEQTSFLRQMLVLPKSVTDKIDFDVAVSFGMKKPLTEKHVLKQLKKL